MKTIFSLLAVLLVALPSFAGTQAATKAAETALSTASPQAMQTYQLGSLVVGQKVWVLKAVYDFSVLSKVASNAGVSGTVPLRGLGATSLRLPKGALVTDCVIDVIVDLTGTSSATLSVSTGQTVGDLKTATAVTNYTSGSGRIACVPVGSAATSIKLTADRTPSVGILRQGSSPLAFTAGKMNVLIEYILSDTP